MARKLVAKVGSYTNSQNEEKGEYVTIGVILSNDNGEYALLDPTVNLAGVLMKQRVHAQKTGGKSGDMIMCGIYDQQQNNQGQQQQGSSAQQYQNATGGNSQNTGGFTHDYDPMDDGIPF